MTCKNNSLTCKGPTTKNLCRSCYKKEYRKNNLERLRKQGRFLYHKNVDKCKAANRKFKYSMKGRYKYMLYDSKRRDLECNLSFEEYSDLISKLCFYCEKPLPASSCTGLDRKYNGIGYITGNVVPCCGPCNVLRGNKFTVPEMKLAIMIIKFFREEGYELCV